MAKYRLIGPKPEPTNWAVLVMSAVMAGLLAGIFAVVVRRDVPFDVRGAHTSFERNIRAQ